MKHYDAIVVGGGPAGITAALYLCRSGLSVAQIEMLAPGGQILKTESIENYPGFPKGIKGWEMADAFAAHLDGYELDRYNDAVLKMEQVPGGWLFSIGKETIVGKAGVVCSGANPRPLGVPRETELTGRGVSYCALCDGNFFRDQVVAVVGGGNSALEEALYLSRIASKLYLIHRREGFRAAKVYQDKIRAASDKIELVLDTVVTGLIGEGSLQGLQLKMSRPVKKHSFLWMGCSSLWAMSLKTASCPPVSNWIRRGSSLRIARCGRICRDSLRRGISVPRCAVR